MGKAEDFIKKHQNGVLLNDYTLKDMIWFMENYIQENCKHEYELQETFADCGLFECIYCEKIKTEYAKINKL